MAKRKTARRNTTPRTTAAASRRSESPSATLDESNPQSPISNPQSKDERATLAVLVYLCGDNHIEKYTKEYLQRMLGFGPSTNLHLVVQHDTPIVAKRYVVRAGNASKIEEKDVRRDVNTGDPKALEEFLEWGLKTVSAEHHVLILSGLGLNPRYVRQSLPLESLPEALQDVRGGKPGDPNEEKYSQAFTDCIQNLSPGDLAKYREQIQNRLFSICHDFSNSGSLGVSELRQVLAKAVHNFDEIKRDPRFDVVLFDVGAAAFVEVLFELEGLARVFIGSREMLPDEGFPYTEIFRAWDTLAGEAQSANGKKRGERPQPLAHKLANSFLETVRTKFGADNPHIDGLIAANLETLDEVARALDSVAMALLHSLGDWHVLDAIYQATDQLQKKYVTVAEPGSEQGTSPPASKLSDIEFLPAVDLFELLDELESAFNLKLQSGQVPVKFGQHERLQKLYKLLRKTVAHLHSPHLLSDDSADGSLLLSKKNRNIRQRQGLSILLPPGRSQEEIKAGTGKLFSLSSPSYSKLNFSRRVHWSALVGAIQMIYEKPHALWRVISSMLADASSPARDAALGRLISKQSVVSELRGQFQSLGESESLTMSLDPLESNDSASDLGRFQVRLEPSLGGAVVYQQDSRIYKSSLEATLRDLHALLHDSQPIEELQSQLRSLGASLGEDIIQDLVNALENERALIIANSNETPHLTLQMPRELMRYPWELMHDRHGLLCERFALGRQVFMETQFVRPIPRRSTDEIRVLVIGDPEYSSDFKQRMAKQGFVPSPLPSARLEAATIVRAFEQLNDEMAGVVEFKVTPLIGTRISMNDMRMYLRDGWFDIIHYAGHAFFETGDADGSAWVLSDGLLHAREIRNTLAWAQCPPWLVFANACEAGMDAATPRTANDVSGLATACINQGVAAYIAPLWPVDDEIARWLAVGFYRELLRERYSVGEALRRARVAIWHDLQASGAAQAMPAKTALTWSSFVLYGDPTARLLQSLWTPSNATELADQPTAEIARSTNFTPLVTRRFRQATSGQLAETIDLPKSLVLPTTPPRASERGVGVAATGGVPETPSVKIELVERNGVRFWRTVTGDAATGARTFSQLGNLLDDRNDTEVATRSRQIIRSMVGHERGVMDFVGVVKSWVVKKFTGAAEKTLVAELIEQFDREQVPEEGLYRLVTPTERRRIRPEKERRRNSRDLDSGEWLQRNAVSGQMDRALLVVHGTFSKGQPTFDEFAKLLPADHTHSEKETESLMNWMLRRYRAVLGFDHWTLSKSPEENAKKLLEQLPKLWRNDKGNEVPLELDIICHSRGGLVTRALIEMLLPEIKIRRVIFVGVPNAGTNLANPANWGSMADVLINLVTEDPTGLLGRLSGFLFYMLAQGLTQQVPGLQAMNPLSVNLAGKKGDPNSFLARLQKPDPATGAEYFVVASNYVPDRNSLSILSILKEAGDQLLDKFFDTPNDLVVDTASMWAFDTAADWSRNVHKVPPANVLLFNTERGGPDNIPPQPQAGVHHVNYFLQRAVRDFIRQQLDSV